MAFRVFDAQTYVGSATLYYDECRDAVGVEWTEPVAVAVGVDTGSYALAWTGSGFIALYTRSGVPYAKWTDDPDNWPSDETDLSTAGIGVTGTIHALAVNSLGVLLLLIYQASNATYVRYVSRDQGESWAAVGSATRFSSGLIAVEDRCYVVRPEEYISEVTV